jgi:hypothetical protein
MYHCRPHRLNFKMLFPMFCAVRCPPRTSDVNRVYVCVRVRVGVGVGVGVGVSVGALVCVVCCLCADGVVRSSV